jgi:hypothetical protein
MDEALVARSAECACDLDDAAAQVSSCELQFDHDPTRTSAAPRRLDSIQPDRLVIEHSRLGSVRRTRIMRPLICRWHSPDPNETFAVCRHLPGSMSVHWLG